MKQERKRLYVDKSVQGALAKRIGYHWLFFFGIVLALKILTSWSMEPTASFGEVLNTLVKSNGFFLLVLVLLLPSFIYDSVKLSNRFAGPMVRLKNELDKAAESGEFREMSFRDGDFWIDIADSYNSMIHAVNEKLGLKPDGSQEEDGGVETATSEEENTQKSEMAVD